MKATALTIPKEISYVPATIAFIFFWFFSLYGWSVSV